MAESGNGNYWLELPKRGTVQTHLVAVEILEHVAGLAAVLSNPEAHEPQVRKQAIAELEAIGPVPAAIEAASLALGDSSQEVSVAAIQALIRFGEDAIPVLHEVLTGGDGTRPYKLRKNLRKNAADALANIPGMVAITLLFNEQEHENPYVRQAAEFGVKEHAKVLVERFKAARVEETHSGASDGDSGVLSLVQEQVRASANPGNSEATRPFGQGTQCPPICHRRTSDRSGCEPVVRRIL